MLSLFKLIDKYVGIPLCIIIGILTKFFPRSMREPTKILVIKLWAVGDSVVSLPMFRVLRKHFPKAAIDVLCKRKNSQVYEGISYINKIILFEAPFIDVLKLLRRYDAVIDTEPWMRLSALLSWYAAPRRIGFAKQVRSILYTDNVLFNKAQHMVENYLDLAAVLGVKEKVEELVPLHVNKADTQAVEDFLAKNGVKRNDFLVAVCPGAGETVVQTRKWRPDDNYSKFADAMIEKHHAKVLLVGLPNVWEKQIVEQVKQYSKHKDRLVDCLGLNLKQTAYLLGKCKLAISNDTSPMHIAAAMGAPTIGLFGPNIPNLWRPFGKKNAFVYHQVACSPCIINDKGKVPDCLRDTDKFLCMRKSTAKEVIKLAEFMLKEKIGIKLEKPYRWWKAGKWAKYD